MKFVCIAHGIEKDERERKRATTPSTPPTVLKIAIELVPKI